MQNILLVEDEADLRTLMTLHLKREGWNVCGCETAEQAMIEISKTKFQLFIIDWMLPGRSGLEICAINKGAVPILMVTARADAADIVMGLESGADDYLTKPFEIPVFIARVRALLRRSKMLEENLNSTLTSKVQKFGNIEYDESKYLVKISGQEIQLTPSEFKLLGALIKNAGRVLTRDRLIECVQGTGVSVIDRTVDTHVFGLRKKLGTASDMIETIRGIGYRMTENP